MAARLFTFGHGAGEADRIAALIRDYAIASVADVRSVPKSRKHPQFVREEMEIWVPALADARYRWEPALGGFRKMRLDSPNVALRHPSFRGYADYMQTLPFLEALDALTERANETQTAIMCSETLWWRCHRRLISDAAMLLRGVDVVHVAPGSTPAAHVPTDGVRVDGDVLTYDVLTPP